MTAFTVTLIAVSHVLPSNDHQSVCRSSLAHTISCNTCIYKALIFNSTRSFLHGPISKDEADTLLLADGGAEDSGRFLFREKKVCYDCNSTFNQADRVVSVYCTSLSHMTLRFSLFEQLIDYGYYLLLHLTVKDSVHEYITYKTHTEHMYVAITVCQTVCVCVCVCVFCVCFVCVCLRGMS